ncbi:MAG: hypothetical protein ACWA5P_00845 [bacterium]
MKKKHRKKVYSILFIVGLCLMGWQIAIYRNTIIDVSVLFTIILSVGLIAFLIDHKNYKKTFKYDGIVLYFYSAIHYVCGIGFIVCALFMLTNFYLADKSAIKESYEIVDRDSLPGRKYHRNERKPTFSIDYNGTLKELVFPHSYYDKMDDYSTVELEVRKGFFGYDILVNKTLN